MNNANQVLVGELAKVRAQPLRPAKSLKCSNFYISLDSYKLASLSLARPEECQQGYLAGRFLHLLLRPLARCASALGLL